MVMPWSRSDWKESIRNAHSNGMPRRSHIALICSSLPSGSEPVSWNSRPTSVDLPWSTWPTMTMRIRSRSELIKVFVMGRASHIAGGAQPLERVFGLAIHGAARALRRLGPLQLGDDRFDRVGDAVDRERDVLVAERAVALAVLGEIQLDHRDLLARDVAPDVHLGPMQQRMDTQVRAGRQVGVEIVPEFRRLVAEVPLPALAARAEHPLLGAHSLLVAPDAGDDAVEAVALDRIPEADGLARRRARGRR